MAAHASLTGSNLHEPKGASGASVGTCYVSDGAGSGTWKANPKYKHTVQFPDISTADFILVPVPTAATLNKCTVILNNAVTTGNGTLSFINSSGAASLGTLTVVQSGSAEGSRFTFTPSGNNSFSSTTYLKIATDGACDTTCKSTLFLEWTLN